MAKVADISIRQLLFIIAGAAFSFSLLLFEIGTNAIDHQNEAIKDINTEIKGINQDVGGIRTDVAVIKAQISSLHYDVRTWYNESQQP